jgi:hypothetical protein
MPQSMIQNKSYMTNQGVPSRFITNQLLYVPGQNIVSQNKDRKSNAANVAANVSANVSANVAANVSADVSAMSFQTLFHSTITEINEIVTPSFTPNVFAASTSDGCKGKCNCNDPSLVCCQYCDIELDCGCTAFCCEQIQSIISRWYSCLPVNTVINTLTYRLGAINTSAGFNITSTVNSIVPPFNNNLFMSINDEMGFNNMDVAMPEDYAVTNDTTGQVKLMFAKIMFSGIGNSGESQTLFQNPLEFETPLGKLDRLTFKIYYDDAAITPVWLASPFPQLVNEWNAIINIEEEVAQASRITGWSTTPTIPVPSNPNATPYLAYTSKSENNKK